jgi:hypothetical protein
LLFSSLRHNCSSSLSDMIVVLYLRHDYCSPLSDMIVVLLSQTWS